MGLANTNDNTVNEEEELRKVLEFLRLRFTAHRDIYGSSFAQQLNNEAAVEIAEVMFSPQMVSVARDRLKCEKELSDLGA